jgi:hypothetical protein
VHSAPGISRGESLGPFRTRGGEELLAGDNWPGRRASLRFEEWILTLLTSPGLTRVRAPFVNHADFRLCIRRKQWLDRLPELFGARDPSYGFPDWERHFQVDGTHAAGLLRIVGNERVRYALAAERDSHLQILINDPAVSVRLPYRVHVVEFTTRRVVNEAGGLDRLRDAVAETLLELRALACPTGDLTEYALLAIKGPGGTVEAEGIVIWDGDAGRLRAAEHLGGRREPRAVPGLVRALGSRNQDLRAKAAWALGEIGDAAAVPELIPLLGETNPMVEDSPGVEALRKLGAGPLAEALLRTLYGGPVDSAVLPGEHAGPVTAALIRAVRTAPPEVAANACAALADLGAVDALPALRAALRERSHDQALKEAVGGALSRLENQASLPRPATTLHPEPSALPRVPGG